ncbi:hypothetical protein [Enterococcus sp. BWR-S5]|uniref:hypothetical protein n=1 Tax=Enterococcus sp. BWR-S5 TaxID=2787714 RepID=UPI00192201C9|nr:hypothetical protein [Enterococcus sp. BWR-S5]MBL1224970.1 hypothetical protein [Enterococcus sp. BWR-S5]
MVKEKVLSIKKEIKEREEGALQQAVQILITAFDTYLLKELDKPGVIKAGYIGIASNDLFSDLGIEGKYLGKQGFKEVFKYIKTYCKKHGMRVKVHSKETKFFYLEIVFIEYRPFIIRVKERVALLINRYLLANG